MTRRRTSVIIRCFNEERHIGRLLSGLVRQSPPPDEIIVVDSGSTDATLAIASRFPVAIDSIQPERFSFGASLNIGCRAASGDLVVLASAHVYPVYDTWLSELTRRSTTRGSRSPTVAKTATGARSTPSSGSWRAGSRPRRWRRQDHPFCNNANAAIRRSVWGTTVRRGPHRARGSRLGEARAGRGHADLLRRHGAVVHVHEESWAQLVNRYRREAIAHKRIYHEKRMSALEACHGSRSATSPATMFTPPATACWARTSDPSRRSGSPSSSVLSRIPPARRRVGCPSAAVLLSTRLAPTSG